MGLRGLSWADLPVFAQAQRKATPRAPESRLQQTLRVINKTTRRQRPIIDAARCTGCADCIQICPIGLITPGPHGKPLIDYARCVDCMVCADACEEHAIKPDTRGWPAAALWPLKLTRHAWRRSKNGHVWHIGNVSLRWQLKKTKPVRKPRQPAPPERKAACNTRAARRVPPPKQGALPSSSGSAPGWAPRWPAALPARGWMSPSSPATANRGQRALAQCMARELGPKGIHVAHVIIDGGILKEGGSALQWERMAGLYPDEIAENYLALHRQHPSTWTQELDLRPWLEKF